MLCCGSPAFGQLEEEYPEPVRWEQEQRWEKVTALPLESPLGRAGFTHIVFSQPQTE